MSFQKDEPIRDKKLTNASRGRQCSHCDKFSPTVVRAHYTGFRQHQYGKGRSIKGHDLIAADLCSECHQLFDDLEMGEDLGTGSDYVKEVDQSEKFLHCVAITLIRDYKEGVLKT